jgi:adenosine deaminase
MTIQEFIHTAPKAELHTHIDGGLRPSTVIEIAKKEKIALPSFVESNLKEILTNDESCSSLIEYFKPFDTTISVMQSQDALERVMYEFLEDSSKDNIRYIEARFSPALHLTKGLSLKEVMEAVIRGKNQAEQNFNIKSKLIICGLRQNDIQKNKELAQLAVDYKNKGVAAFDLAGEELGRPAKNHIPAFEIAIQNNLFRTVHAGEADGAHSIADAIHYLGAQRIGHGTHLFEDIDLLNYVRDRQIGLEVCLTSNIQTKSVTDLSKHPFKSYFDQNIAVTLNTDSTLISGTSLSKEYILAQELFNFSKADILKLILNSFEQAFLSYDEKQELIKNARKQLDNLT